MILSCIGSMVQLEVIRIHTRDYVVRRDTNAVANVRAQHFAQLTVEDLFEVFPPRISLL